MPLHLAASPSLARLLLAPLLAAPCGAALAPPPPQAEALQFTSSDAAALDHFGRSMALSGETLVVGSRYAAHDGMELAGAAYVLVQHGLTWIEQAKLVADDAEYQDLFGHSVAVSGDTVLVGARNDDHGGVVDAGSVHVFVREAAGWSLQAKLTAFDAADLDAFGISLAIDGDTAAIGVGLDDHPGGTDAGSVYIFVREGGTWSLQAKLTAADAAAGDSFGRNLAISGDTLLIGAPRNDHAGGVDAGAAYVFERAGTIWAQQAKLVAVDAKPGDEFGDATALAGATAVVGATSDDHTGAPNAGSATVFVRAGAAWTPQAKLVPDDAAAGDKFGGNLSLAGDVLVIGSSLDDLPGVVDAGSAYRFVRSGTAWTQQAKLTASDPQMTDNFGTTVALADNAILVGAPHDDPDDAKDAGSVYVIPLDADCDGNGVPDVEDLALGTSADCNQNRIPDACDIAAGTSLDLDAEGTPDECQPFSSSGPALSIATGGTLDLTLDAGPSHAGEPFLVLGSASGATPGIPVDGQVLPLNPDGYLILTLSGGGPIQGGSGSLDVEGRASAALVLPPAALAPALAGQVVHHAFAAVNPALALVSLTSNAIPTALEP